MRTVKKGPWIDKQWEVTVTCTLCGSAIEVKEEELVIGRSMPNLEDGSYDYLVDDVRCPECGERIRLENIPEPVRRRKWIRRTEEEGLLPKGSIMGPSR